MDSGEGRNEVLFRRAVPRDSRTWADASYVPLEQVESPSPGPEPQRARRTVRSVTVSIQQHMTHAAIAIEHTGRVDEHALIARVLAGDRVAGRQLYDAHAARVYRLTYRLAGDAELAREFTQDAFVRAFSQLGRFRGDAAFATWLHRIAVTVTLNGMRKIKRLRERETDLEDTPAFGVMGHEADPDLKVRLARALDALPEAFRIVVVMHDIEGYTHSEIAELLGIAEGTSKSRLFDARGKLREALADFARE